MPGQVPERYELIQRIAVGGMAEVFLAKASGLHGFEKTVAIKRILPELASSPEFESRFVREAQVAASLTHSNIVQVFDFGRFQGSLFIAMEFVDGPDLRELLKALQARGERFPLAAAFHIALGLSQGLDFAHRRGVVHRDVSLSNVLVSYAGDVKVADFGIALVGGADPQENPKQLVGKLPYMSPEQTRGQPLDTRSDLFSLGAVLFELFTGQRLFDGRTSEELLVQVREQPIPLPSKVNPSLPTELDAVLLKLLERDRDRRMAGASELLRELRDLAQARSLVSTPIDVGDLVTRVLPREARAKKNPLEQGLQRLLGAGPSSEDATEIARPLRHRTLAAEEPPTVGLTWVRGATDDGGVTSWREVADGAEAKAGLGEAGDSPLRGRSPVRWMVVSVVAGLVLAAGGYVALSGRGEVPAPAVPQAPEAPAPRATGEVSIESTPPGAQVWLDGVRLESVTPTVLTLEADVQQRLELKLDGHRVWSEPLHAQSGVRLMLRPRLEPLPQTLSVRSEPSGAAVIVDGVSRGVTPLKLELPNDRAKRKLVLRREGHEPYERTLQWSAGKDRLEVNATLQPVTRMGRIDLFVEPWAVVYLGDQKLGNAPVKGLKLPYGKHRLKLVNPIQRRQTFVDVVVPSKTPYRVTLP